MGLFLRQDDNRSELQSRVAAELQEKIRTTPLPDAEPTESQFLANQHHTRFAGVVIAILTFILILVAIWAITINS